VNAAQALDPFGQIPGATANPLTRNAVLAACRWSGDAAAGQPAADPGRSVDVFAGSGLAARTLLGQLVAYADQTPGAGHGRRLGPGVMLTGNVLVIDQHGLSVAVQLTGTPPQAAGAVLERFAPVLAGRVAAGSRPGPAPARRSGDRRSGDRRGRA
jgi:hypothetical protein